MSDNWVGVMLLFVVSVLNVLMVCRLCVRCGLMKCGIVVWMLLVM